MQNTEIIIYKPLINENAFFNTSTDWTIGTDWGIVDSQATHTPGSSGLLSQDILKIGKEYKATIKVVSNSAGTTSVLFGGSGSTIIGTGILSYTGTATAVTFSISASAASDIVIEWIKVEENPGNYSLELNDNIDIPLTYNIADIRNPDKRNTTYSKTATVPGTKFNNKIFGEIYEISGDGTYNVNKKAKAIILQDGLEIFNGVVQLTNIIRKQDGYNDYDLISYELNFIGKLADIFYEFGDKKISDLSFSEYTHTFNQANQLDTWLNGIVQKNAINYSNVIMGSNKTFTSIVATGSGTQTRVQLIFSTAHGFTIDDHLWLSDSGLGTTLTSNPRLTGYHTIYRIDSTTTLTLNYGWNSLNTFTANGVAQTYEMKGEGYVYPMIDYGLTDYVNWSVNNLYPALFLKEYIDKMFQDANFSYQSNFFESAFFKRLIVPFNAEKALLSDTERENRECRATNKIPQTGTLKQIYNGTTVGSWGVTHSSDSSGILSQIIDDDSTNGGYDPGNNFSIVTYRYTVPITGNYKLNSAVMTKFYRTTDTTGYSPFNLNADVKLWIYNVTTGAVIAFNITQPSSYLTQTVSNTSVWLQAGQEIECRVEFSVGASNWRETPISPVGNPFAFDIDWEWMITDKVFQVNFIDTTITDGSTLDPTATVPQNVLQKDLFMDVVRMFNLYIETDEDNDRKLYIEPRNDFYDSTNVDWTSKLDTSKDVEIKPMGELQAKEYVFSYKEDKDYFNEQHKKDYNEVYGTEKIEIDNDFINGKAETKLKVVSATPIAGPNQFYTTTPDRYLSAIYQADIDTGSNIKRMNSNVRILYWGPRGTSSAWNHVSLNDGTDANTIYPYAGHLDNIFGPIYDLNFGYPGEVYYDYTTWTDNNLYNEYYSQFIEEITDKNSKIVTCWLRLKPYDIFKLNFRRLYVIDNHFLRLNKIQDYNVNSDSLTKCEFIKAESKPPFTRLSHIGVTFGGNVSFPNVGGGPSLGGNIKPDKYDIQVRGSGNYVGNNTKNVNIEGLNNYLDGNTERVMIVGDDNRIYGGVNDIVIINTDGVTADKSGYTWINGVMFNPQGGFVNTNINIIDAGVNIVLNPFNDVTNVNFIDGGKDNVLGTGSPTLTNSIDAGEDEV